MPVAFTQSESLSITVASVLDLSEDELLEQVQGCRAVVSCLGHNLTFAGMFGQPRRLVSECVQRLCQAIEKTEPLVPVKFILMNTTGNQNTQAGERVSASQSFVVGLIRHLLPPHADNETAADFLQLNYAGSQSKLEWVAVRPDSLVNDELVTEYDVFASPIRSAIFDAGTTSRINVANLMTKLLIDKNLWQKWKGQMPVIYNAVV